MIAFFRSAADPGTSMAVVPFAEQLTGPFGNPNQVCSLYSQLEVYSDSAYLYSTGNICSRWTTACNFSSRPHHAETEMASTLETNTGTDIHFSVRKTCLIEGDVKFLSMNLVKPVT